MEPLLSLHHTYQLPIGQLVQNLLGYLYLDHRIQILLYDSKEQDLLHHLHIQSLLGIYQNLQRVLVYQSLLFVLQI